MGRHTAESQLTTKSSVRFALATPEHDAALRRLLRDNPLPGAISLAFEREPSYFAGANLGGAHEDTIVAFEGDRLVCMGRISTRDRFVNGRKRRVGYLGELRLDKTAQGRFDILRRGYDFFREIQNSSPADFYFTSISAENRRSIRFLERRLPGMPVYEFLQEFTTLLIAVPRSARERSALELEAEKAFSVEGLSTTSGSITDLEAIATFLNSLSAEIHLASCWSAQQLSSLTDAGLSPSDFHLLTDGKRIVGCGALWDQRSFRQIVIRGYDHKLQLAKPFYNGAARFLNLSPLPATNSVLAQAFLSPFAWKERNHSMLNFIATILLKASERKMDHMTVGFDSRDVRIAQIKNKFRFREYRSRLYRVSWGSSGATEPLNEGLFSPEVALL